MKSEPIPFEDASVPPVLWRTLLRDAREVYRFGLEPEDLLASVPSCGVVCLEAIGPSYPAGIRVAFTDPQVHGGSFTTQNLRMLRAFVTASAGVNRPFVLVLSTGGVRITQPRTIFQDVFGSIPDLFTLRRHTPLITVAIGKTLGIGALYFGQGHFRIAGGEETLINLTGPMVLDGFFGGSTGDFTRFASAGHQLGTNHLIQELTPTADGALERVRELLRYLQVGDRAPDWPTGRDEATGALLRDMADSALEVFPAGAFRWKTYLCRSQGKLFGLITQPPRNPDNLLGVPEVLRALDGVRLFAALGLPLVSAIDSPGGDPRQAASDADMVLHSLALADALSSYPHPKLGLLLARCYGGIGVFALPRDHGSLGLYALEGAQIGIMSNAIIDGLVKPGSKLRAEWEETKRSHAPDMREMVASGNVQGFWKRGELKERLGELLFGREGR